MARTSAGIYGAFHNLEWRGGQVRQQVDSIIHKACQDEARHILTDLRATLHRHTNEMADNAYAYVSVENGRRVINIGSTADHTFIHEFGLGHYPAHPQFRQAMDRHVPHLADRMRG